jgi:hypothetical protein
MIFQQHFPNIIDRVIALHLYNDSKNPKQIDLVFSYIPSIDRFIHLRSLSLSNIYTYIMIMKILNQCHQLPDLISLKFHSCYFTDYRTHFQLIIDNIWTLPKLIHCEIDIFFIRRLKFCLPTKISSSLESLRLIQCTFNLNQINQLFERTPRLKHLSISIKNYADDYLPILLTTLISLKIRIYRTQNASKIVRLLQNMPNLRRLDMHILFHIIDSDELKHMITNYLPKLKKFHFKMSNPVDFIENLATHMLNYT